MSRLQHRTVLRSSAVRPELRWKPFVGHLDSDNAEYPTTLSVFYDEVFAVGQREPGLFIRWTIRGDQLSGHRY